MPKEASFQVRRATPADAAEIARVHIESSEDAYAPLAATWEAPDAKQRTEMWREWMSGSTHRVDLVAELEGEVVGFIAAGQPRRSDVNAEVEVYVIHVLPSRRGRGIGGRLWSRVCDSVRGKSLRSMYVGTFAELRCCSFYERHGGELVESKQGSFKGGGVTKVVYLWRSGQTSSPDPAGPPSDRA